MPSTASRILMIRPAAFGYNIQTAENNSFQMAEAFSTDLVLEQFETAVRQLKDAGIEVLVVEDQAIPPKPDAIFPNNWFSVVGNTFQLYPMFAPNRRLERRPELKERIEKFIGTKLKLVDWSHYEQQNMFLEGTGSLVIDRNSKVVCASISPRTDMGLVQLWGRGNGFTPIVFHALDSHGQPIYHTNVVMGLGADWAVICTECVDSEEHGKLLEALRKSNKDIIEITRDQMNSFAGNCIGLSGSGGSGVLVFSKNAWNSLNEIQHEKLKSHGTPIVIDVSEIERVGGGSIRCMIAELG